MPWTGRSYYEGVTLVALVSLLDLLVPAHCVRILGETHDEINDPARLLSADVKRHAQLLLKGLEDQHSHKRIMRDNSFFTQCGRADAQLRELSDTNLELHGIGKLAKSGDFFTSSKRRWLLKAINSGEKTALINLGGVRPKNSAYKDCTGLRESLLVQIPLIFDGPDGRPYIVMRNETQRLMQIVSGSWKMHDSYDVKPLPNLSGDLAKLVCALRSSWLSKLAPLSRWDGWSTVRSVLDRDFKILETNSKVDFSLFIHVLRCGLVTCRDWSPTLLDESSTTEGLVGELGCIMEPTGAVLVCFSILDYLMEYGIGRKFESATKHDKFSNYGEKLLHAFDCLGGLDAESCEGYYDYSNILAAGESETKAVLMGTSTFQESYECTVETPRIRYEVPQVYISMTPFYSTKVVDDPSGEYRQGSSKTVMLNEEFQLDDGSFVAGNGQYDQGIAQWLQNKASREHGAYVVGHGYIDFLDSEYKEGNSNNRTFGSIEVLQVVPSQSSGIDFEVDRKLHGFRRTSSAV